MTILVPVDSDSLRDDVVETAVALAEGLDQELYVVHLIQGEVADGREREIRDDIRSELDDVSVPVTVALELLSRRGTRAGDRIGQEVIDIASDVDISHVVMGHRSKGLLADLTQGSAAFSVADQASVPVTIVPESATDG